MFSGLKSRWIMLCEWMNWQALMIYQIIFLAYSNLNMMMSKFELPRGALSPCCHCGPRAPPGSSGSAAQTRGISSHPPWRPQSGWRCGRASATSRCGSPSRPFSSPIRTRCWLYLNKRLWNKILRPAAFHTYIFVIVALLKLLDGHKHAALDMSCYRHYSISPIHILGVSSWSFKL